MVATIVRAVLLAVAVTVASANQLDTVLETHIPPCSCDAWSSAPATYKDMWANETMRDAAGSSCAMPAKATNSLNYHAWCVCSGTPKPCSSALGTPEQINIQLAGSDVVVVSFVTFEPSLPSLPPQAVLTTSAGTDTPLTGVAHWYTTSHTKQIPRNYVMNFVKFANLTARATYSYKVKSGATNGTWSKTFSFRAPYSAADGGETRIAIYGDMGNTLYNNQGNMAEDCASGKIDAILHMGDHCYNMGDDDDARGDQYMNAYSAAALASCPWMPVIGNHESTQCPGDEVDESTHERYLNQTWGAAIGQSPSATSSPQLTTTATSALGHLLTRGSLLAAGVHGASHGGRPSGTSQWYSVDLGLIHLVGLDLDPLLDTLSTMQAWLEQDLAAAVANRHNVPWIIVTSHFPIHNADFESPMFHNASASFYFGEAAETFTTNGHNFVPCASADCETVGEVLQSQASWLDAVLAKYAVDVYDAGHIHSYDTTWPLCNGAICDGKKSYVDPKGTVHITEGNGGVPGVAGTNTVKDCKTAYGRKCGTGGAYGRFITSNATVLSYEHVENPTGKVTDTWAIVKTAPTPRNFGWAH